MNMTLRLYINIPVHRLSSSRAKLASDVGIAVLAILSHEDAYNSVDPLSSEDVVVDSHWFTDCYLEAIFNMNHVESSASIFNHCWRERCSSDCRHFSLNPVQRDILPYRHSQFTVWSNYIRLHKTTSSKSITKTVTITKCSVQLSQCQSRDQSFFALNWSIILQLMYTVMVIISM